jgi:methylmalonyl-CoA/ethylmalonyl-CoA epimerase
VSGPVASEHGNGAEPSTTVHGRLGLRGVDHLGIAVPSIADTVPLFVDLLGAEFVNGADDLTLGIRTVQLRVAPGLRFEVLQPIREDAALASFLAKRGPGVHHITVMVQDVRTAITELEAAGYELVDTDLETDPAWLQTYVRPRSGHGMLLQVVQSDRDWDAPGEGVTLEGVLAGEYVWVDNRSVHRSKLPD